MLHRLRQKIAIEEETFELEYQQRTTYKLDNELQERQDRLMALKHEREQKRQEFVKQKQMQQVLYVCISYPFTK